MSEDDDDGDRDLWRRLSARSAPAEASTCPDAGTLAALLDGSLAPGDREGLEAHLADCPRCVRALADARLIERSPLPALSPERLDRLARVVRGEHAPPLRLPARLAIAAMVLLTCGAGFLLGARAMSGAATLEIAARELPFDVSPVLEVP